MNLLEHYIKEIHNVEEVKLSFAEKSIIVAELTVDCYGITQRQKTSFSNMDEWNKIKEQGYYMA